MGSELMRIAEGFSIVAEGLRGLAKAEGGTKEKARWGDAHPHTPCGNRPPLSLHSLPCRRGRGCR